MLRITLVIVLVLQVIILPAQNQAGFRLSANLSKVVPENPEYENFYSSFYRIGFGAGILHELVINPTFSLYTELNYTNKAKKVESNLLKHFSDARFHYLEFPILLRIGQNYNGFKWYLNGGPQISYWISARGKNHLFDDNYQVFNIKEYKLNFQGINEQRNVGIDEANRTQLNIALGGGFILSSNKLSSLQVDARVILGHTNFSNQLNEGIYAPDFEENYRSAFRSFELSIAYLVNLKELKRKLK